MISGKKCFVNNYILYKDELFLLETISILSVDSNIRYIKNLTFWSPESNLYINAAVPLLIKINMTWDIPLYSKPENFLMNVEGI